MQVMPHKQEYEYAGRVQFVHQQKGSVPVLQLSDFATHSEREDVTHHTIMVTRSGHAYTKRWDRSSIARLHQRCSHEAFQCMGAGFNDTLSTIFHWPCCRWRQARILHRLTTEQQVYISTSDSYCLVAQAFCRSCRARISSLSNSLPGAEGSG